VADSSPHSKVSKADSVPRHRLIVLAIILFGLGGFMGMTAGFASMEKEWTLGLVFASLFEYWPAVILVPLIIVPFPAYRSGGLKGLFLAPLIFMLAIGFLGSIGAVGTWVLYFRINWLAKGNGKLMHAIVGTMFGVSMALPVFLFVWWAHLKELKMKSGLSETIDRPDQTLRL
jgi:hypothetical protein